MRKLLCLCLIFLMLAPAAQAKTAGYGMALIDGVTSDRVHLRRSASTSSDSLGLFFTGTDVMCETDPYASTWVKVMIGASEGYMMSRYLVPEGSGTVTPRQPIGIVSTNTWVNVRSAPSITALKVDEVRNGYTVTILGETHDHWYYVQTDSTIGYIMADYVTMQEAGAIRPTTAPITPSSPADIPAALSAYRAVMEDRATFVMAGTRGGIYLYEALSQVGQGVYASQFAVLDLDNDGMVELVIKEMIAGNEYGSMVLDWQNNAVYGYSLPLRGFMELKYDGSASYSSGASDNGFGWLTLTTSGYQYNASAYCASNGYGVSYYVNGRTSTQASYLAATQQQDAKQNASWYDFNATNFDNFFGDTDGDMTNG